jgi:hypothetical protein
MSSITSNGSTTVEKHSKLNYLSQFNSGATLEIQPKRPGNWGKPIFWLYHLAIA